MVCIPCIVVPVLLYIWHRFLQPIVLKFWNPFGKVEDKKEDSNSTTDSTKKTCPFASTSEKVPDGHPVVSDNEPLVTENETMAENKPTNMGACVQKIQSTEPDDLESFGYRFNEDGELRDLKTDGPFEFNIKPNDHSYNQKRYEKIGDAITEVIYKLLVDDCGLTRLCVPINPTDEIPQTFIFASNDAFSNTDKLMILIHGSGVVRAGQWARRLIINDSLTTGTQFPYIKRAMKEGYGVVVLNTNDNSQTVDGKKKAIQGSETPEQHANYVWEKYIKTAQAKKIFIVAHSFGGVVTTSLFKSKEKEFVDRVSAVAFTDSVHFIPRPASFKPLIKITKNWVVSKEPLDTPLKGTDCITRVSSGAQTHEMTSSASIESVFKFFDDMDQGIENPTTTVESEDHQDSDSEPEFIEFVQGTKNKQSNSDATGNHELSDTDEDDSDQTVRKRFKN